MSTKNQNQAQFASRSGARAMKANTAQNSGKYKADSNNNTYANPTAVNPVDIDISEVERLITKRQIADKLLELGLDDEPQEEQDSMYGGVKSTQISNRNKSATNLQTYLFDKQIRPTKNTTVQSINQLFDAFFSTLQK